VRGASPGAGPSPPTSAAAIAKDACGAASGPEASTPVAPAAGLPAGDILVGVACRAGEEEPDVVSARTGMGSMFIGKPNCPSKEDHNMTRWHSAFNQCNMPERLEVESPRISTRFAACGAAWHEPASSYQWVSGRSMTEPGVITEEPAGKTKNKHLLLSDERKP